MIDGYDCECEEKSPIDPFSRKPVPTNDNYNFFNFDVVGWHEYQYTLGWTSADGWNVIPMGQFGHWILLDQWEIFGY